MATKKTPARPLKKAAKASKKVSKVVKTKDGVRLKKLTRRQASRQAKTSQKQNRLPNAWILLGRSLRHLYRHKKLFAGIVLVYGIVYILFVKGISANFQLGDLRKNLDTTFSGELNGLSTGVALYGLLLGSAGSSSDQAGGVLQTVLVIIVSLALIWALRQTYAGSHKISVRDSFYKSTTPLIPFLLVTLVIFVQFLPALIFGSLYSVIQANGLAVGFGQQAVALAVLGLALLWSFYMIGSSLFALYIVTLPNATPLASLRAAKKLVRYRRWVILRKVFILPTVLLLASAIILIPLIILLPVAAELLFIVFTISVLAVVHSYLYTLYRSML